MGEPTLDTFRARISEIQQRPDWKPPEAFGLGFATRSLRGDGPKVLDTFFPAPNLGANLGFAALICDLLDADEGSAVPADGTYPLSADLLDEAARWCAPVLADGGSHPNAELIGSLRAVLDQPPSALLTDVEPVLVCCQDLSNAPRTTSEVYLRLHLLSHRLVRPHGLNLEGQFGLLPNVVWTSEGPADPDGFDLLRAQLRGNGRRILVTGVDKFPRMCDYVVPTGVRIAHADRVRLGAYLAEGTTVMHEGFVNFNAGTLGNAMVEGRISAGVVVGANSDIGGGASIMGTLSGGGTEVISLGEGCLLGANGGVGISLGDRCTVEAGLYLTAGTRVTLPDATVVKARELSGRSDMLFRRNSSTGVVEVLASNGNWGGLNESLHSNA